MGRLTAAELHRCPNCAVETGQTHMLGCDVARCKECGMQAFWCVNMHDEDEAYRTSWMGIWPGEQECQDMGLWAYYDMELGLWIECSENHPQAKENLNLLATMINRGDVVWNKELERFIRPNG